MFSKLKNFLALSDDEIEEYDDYEQEKEYQEKPFVNKSPKANVVSLSSVQQQAKVILLEPRSYSEAQDIADHLKNRRSVVINLQRMNSDQAKRMVDFLSGTVYAVGGDIQKLGVQTFICTPDNVDLSGTITESIASEDRNDIRW
ncbi:MAG: cell division machinery factor [Bacillales bacterium]|jgi:cell division inhibitor SepF|nr:cell division machinery factor [Bacillales bacterium]